MAVRHADRSSLPLVDFIIQNGCVPKCSQCSLPLSLMEGMYRMLVCSRALTSLLLALYRGTLDRVTQDGNTALHYGALYNQPNCLKLLLKGKAAFTIGMRLGWGFWGSSVGW